MHVIGFVLLAVFIASHAHACIRANVQQSSRRTADGASLRQITQAAIIHAHDHNGAFPTAANIWDYAALLAESTGLNDPRMWTSRLDPAPEPSDRPTTILPPTTARQPRQLHPEFRNTIPAVAVVLSGLDLNVPDTTPIAWTRGLQPDGTWAKHSPHGQHGGWIGFKNGTVVFFRTLGKDGGQLTRFDGKGTTANILEALPPGVRIGEYVPTPEEQIAWSKITDDRIKRQRWQRYLQPEVIALLIIWAPFIFLAIYRHIKKRDHVIKTFRTPLILSGILLFLMSISC